MDTCEICQREAYNTHSTAGDACCWRGAHAMPSPHWKLECYRLGFERLKAENASLLESLRAAEQLAESRGRMLSDSMALHENANRDLFAADKKAAAAEQRAEAAEQDLGKQHSLTALRETQLTAAEQRNTALEGALVRLLETQTWSFSDEQAAAIDHACDNVLGRRVAARAALHDEERPDVAQHAEALIAQAAGFLEAHEERIGVTMQDEERSSPSRAEPRAAAPEAVESVSKTAAQGEEK